MIFVIIPAFNEEEALDLLLPRIPQLVHGHRVRTLVVSDGSTDGTAATAVAHRVPVLALTTNQGKGSAIRAALSALPVEAASALVLMDGDGQHRPEDLARLVEPVLRGTADFALASRYLVDSRRANTPLNRYVVRTGTAMLLRRMLGRSFTDPYCGYRAISTAVLDDVAICGERYEGELEALFDACRCGLRIVEIPIDRIYGAGMSKMASQGGRLGGRLRVIWQYATTIRRKHREAGGGASSSKRGTEVAV